MLRYAPDGARTHLYDGTEEPVREGDRIRTQQYPGGLLPPGEPVEGVAVKFPHDDRALAQIHAVNERQGHIVLDPDELVCRTIYRPGTRYERVSYVSIHHVEKLGDAALDVWLRIPDAFYDGTPNTEGESEAEANTYRVEDGFIVKWSLTAVGLVTSRYFQTYAEARMWLESEGFQGFSS